MSIRTIRREDGHCTGMRFDSRRVVVFMVSLSALSRKDKSIGGMDDERVATIMLDEAKLLPCQESITTTLDSIRHTYGERDEWCSVTCPAARRHSRIRKKFWSVSLKSAYIALTSTLAKMLLSISSKTSHYSSFSHKVT